MTQHKMHVLDGIRYREEDLPEGAKGAKIAKSPVVEDQKTGPAKTIKTPTRRGAKVEASGLSSARPTPDEE